MTEPILSTPRLILRLPAREDLEPWIAFSADPETMRFIGGALPPMRAWGSICAVRGAWSINGFSMFSVIERDTGRWVGRVGPWAPEQWPANEIGWGIAPEFAGRGYAFEAACAAMDFAVDTLGWSDVIHVINPENHRSMRLAERLGSRNRGPVSLPPPLDADKVDAWGQSAAEWRANRDQRIQR